MRSRLFRVVAPLLAVAALSVSSASASAATAPPKTGTKDVVPICVDSWGFVSGCWPGGPVAVSAD
jgi:hypothetical protein